MAIWLADNWCFFLVWWIVLIPVGLFLCLLAIATSDSEESDLAAGLMALAGLGSLVSAVVFKLLFVASLIVNLVLLAKS